jgi:chaperonin GroEL
MRVLRFRIHLRGFCFAASPSFEGQIGVNIVKWAITEPLRMIAENAGEEDAIVPGKINDSKDNKFGYNALTGDYEDLVKAGVLDPTKVADGADPASR